MKFIRLNFDCVFWCILLSETQLLKFDFTEEDFVKEKANNG